MTDPDVYQGRARRRCRDCGVEIEIEKPTRIVSRTSTRAWRKTARQEVGRQICWEMLCPSCRAWWNARLRLIEVGFDEATGAGDEPGSVDLAALNPYSARAARERARLAGCEMAGE